MLPNHHAQVLLDAGVLDLCAGVRGCSEVQERAAGKVVDAELGVLGVGYGGLREVEILLKYL